MSDISAGLRALAIQGYIRPQDRNEINSAADAIAALERERDEARSNHLVNLGVIAEAHQVLTKALGHDGTTEASSDTLAERVDELADERDTARAELAALQSQLAKCEGCGMLWDVQHPLLAN